MEASAMGSLWYVSTVTGLIIRFADLFLISTHDRLESQELTFTKPNYLRTESQSECQFVSLYSAEFHKVFY